MSLFSFQELIQDAEKRNYAVGYFESWNIESLLAVCDAAESQRSPVILGFNGIFLPNERRVVRDPSILYADMVRDACSSINVPACSIFNESPYFNAVLEAIDNGYSIVMFSDENLDFNNQVRKVSEIVKAAHKKKVAVEGELSAMPGVLKGLGKGDEVTLTNPELAFEFVSETGIDALAVNIGQAHYHGKKEIKFDFVLLEKIKEKISIPLVMHGGSYVKHSEISKVIELGVRKINVGSILKKVFIESLKKSCLGIFDDYNPYMTVGSGLEPDILVKARLSVSKVVEKFMQEYNSTGKA